MRFWSVLRKLFFYCLLLSLLAGCAYGVWIWYGDEQPTTQFRVEPVVEGEMLITIDATGTLKPEEEIDVGAQVAGQILRFGQDPNDSTKSIDFNTQVKKDTVLAELDDSLIRAGVSRAKADLARANAELSQYRIGVRRAERELRRVERLARNDVVAREELEDAKIAYQEAQAAVTLGIAVVDSAQATLDEAETNLKYTVIRSPVDGVIISRRVNVGQTVVASLNAPSLFLIAKDLKKMVIWVSVNEADIGYVRKGQEVTFTVDAYRNKVFEGIVKQIRQDASVAQNVVTYTIIVQTDNSDLLLKPYLTANLKFLVQRKSETTMVPNAALRYRPAAARIHPDYRKTYGSKEGTSRRKKGDPAVVWVADGIYAKPVKAKTGVTDGRNTEIVEVLEGELAVGDQVITGEDKIKTGEESVNPFAPPAVFKKKSK